MMYDEQEQVILNAFFDGLRPIPRMTVSEWANQYRMLTSTSSAEPGPYRYQRTPYLRKIMDYLSVTSDVQEIIVMKGAQLGMTEAGNNWAGYTMHIDPGPMLLVMPTEAALKKNSRTRIEPMIEGTPALKERTGRKGEKGTVNTILEKEFPGGFLMMVAAQSPVGLSSTPVGKIMMDEVDRYPPSAGSEGSPVALARARARTFSNRKIYILSTPTVEGDSIVASEFEKGDCQYYHVPCLHCDELFIITFDCFTWEEGKPETTRLACPNCGGLHEERHKTKMLAEKGFSPEGRAEWIATKKSDNPKKVSMHISGYYSPAGMYSWEQAVRDYLDIKNDVNAEIAYTNTVKAETYKVQSEKIDADNIYNRREDYEIGTVNTDVSVITMGVDIQQDRIEAEVVGWCKDRISYSIDYVVLHGETKDSSNDVWQRLRDLINKNFKTDDGYYLPIKLTTVDSSDGNYTKQVYDFCSSMGNDRVVPIKGEHRLSVMVSNPKILNVTKSGKKVGSSKVWGVGVSLIKSEFYGFLRLKAVRDDEGNETYPPGYCHFPDYPEYYFKMLTAEVYEKKIDKTTKKESYQWVKKFERNEALDCRVYARAAAFIVGIDRFTDAQFDRMRDRSKIIEDNPKPKKEPVKKQVSKKQSIWDKRR